MEIITNTTAFKLNRETAVAIGKFDGVHSGHRKLIERILACKKKGLAACVFTFDPSPAVFFGKAEKQLTTKEEKRLLFEQMGVDILVEFPMTSETAAMPPEVFAKEILADKLNVRFLAAGSDLSFGAKGAGNAELLQKLGAELGFSVETIEKVCVDGETVSSTLVRERVETGDMEAAEKLLGMPYMLQGVVVHGKKIGRNMETPTINLIPEEDKLLPPCGVYSTLVSYGGRKHYAITNVGYKPTVNAEPVLGVESHMYSFCDVIYDETVELYFKKFHRPERKFENLEELKAQISRDIDCSSEFFQAAAGEDILKCHIRFCKATNTLSIELDEESLLLRLTKYLEEYKKCLLKDLNLLFTVDKRNKALICQNQDSGQRLFESYDELTAVCLYRCFDNMASMADAVQYTEEFTGSVTAK